MEVAQGFAKQDTAAYWERLVQGTEDGVGKECRNVADLKLQLHTDICDGYRTKIQEG